MIATAGVASADITLSGAARMGLSNTDNAAGSTNDNETQFSSRVRFTATGTGTTDNGYTFGASMRFDQNGGNTDGTANDDSTVYLSGAFGKITMGDVTAAHEAATGDPAGVGYLETGNALGNYIGLDDTALAYTYSVDGLTIHAAVGQAQTVSANDVSSFGLVYTINGITIGAGIAEDNAIDDTSFSIAGTVAGLGLKAVYLDKDGSTVDTESGFSATYAMDALKFTAFTRSVDNVSTADLDYTGVGVSYDMGGGAVLAAGYVDGGADGLNRDTWDLGLNFSF